MKKSLMLLLVFGGWACADHDAPVSDLTGNEVVYTLYRGSQYPINGTVTLQERKGGSTLVVVQLEGDNGDMKHPVHLHFGDVSQPDADIAVLLNPVQGTTGRSETTVTELSDETPVTYADLIKMNACIKVHLGDDGADRNVILVAGNIGSAVTKPVPDGRAGIAVCKCVPSRFGPGL